jgi:hypothetical protein
METDPVYEILSFIVIWNSERLTKSINPMILIFTVMLFNLFSHVRVGKDITQRIIGAKEMEKINKTNIIT